MHDWAYQLTGGGSVTFGLSVIAFLGLFLLFTLLLLLMYFVCWVRYRLSIRTSRSRSGDGESSRRRWRCRQRWDDIRAAAAGCRSSRREAMAMDSLGETGAQQQHASRQDYYRAKLVGSLSRKPNALDKSQPPAYDSIMELPRRVHVADGHRHAGHMV
ncbi:uncharacterized protein LMH87_009115 [Akanthomyces muscarius]|uniref:Uncharacterized protein n=1 Tax=Akanthomyces muscarius TaxID=2231603 RepID=A0A9W8QHM4_AKAMU|nr:uncharacterized protein LMH87_009115 [Akanthomyces muscarius]KAJ4158596.1 hypothetical protein LMH87_009115 [Akanthomyces muscarius]